MDRSIAMPAVIRRVGIAAISLAVVLSTAGCSALLFDSVRDPSGTPTPAQEEQQSSAAACAIVQSEWGWALEPWSNLRNGIGRNDFAQEKIEHLEMISTLQGIADRVESPEVRSALDATIEVHQEYADVVWQTLIDVPEGFIVEMEDPSNALVVLGKQISEYEQRMVDADIQRYDLCGAVQNGQTGAQACEILNTAWADGGLVFNAAVRDISAFRMDEGIETGASALKDLKTALVQVTVPDVVDELGGMYDAYETYYEDGLLQALTEEQVNQLSDDELDDYIAEADRLFADYDGTLLAGEEALVAYCDTQG